ncbi:SMI1/KNR4 family protein [Paenibacillus kobensis]|uniref:SMI1/KNR4 family protein n=1 Tax=Paenibacillus kobensis TaxID=59841 RepID=UPI000FD790BC|nr:SMI1/KNR4 family protein [Paenibacillus kobensis]
MVNQAEQLWKRIIEKGSKSDANFMASMNLQPGANEEDFQRLEQTLSITMPEQLKVLYAIYNGQVWNIGCNPFLRNLTLSPISNIIDNWNFMQEEFDPDGGLELSNDPRIKPYLWHSKWIPIAENGGGDYLCIDTDPSESGTVGQMLYCWHDWGNRSVEANSLFEFIEICLNEEDEM